MQPCSRACTGNVTLSPSKHRPHGRRYGQVMSSNPLNPGSAGATPARDFVIPLPLREQRVTRREELCSRHEEELARLAKQLETTRQEQDAERADWEKFKADLESVQSALDGRQHELESMERALQDRERHVAEQERVLLDRERAMVEQERDLADRSDKLTGVVQRLKQREESINAREGQLASRETALKRETELSRPAGAKVEPLPTGSSMSMGKGIARATFVPPTPSTSGYSQMEFRDEQRIAGPPTAAFQPSGDSEPSVTEQFAGMGIASPDMSVLMADQVMLRAAAKGSSIPGEGNEYVFSQPEESLSALSISRVMMD